VLLALGAAVADLDADAGAKRDEASYPPERMRPVEIRLGPKQWDSRGGGRAIEGGATHFAKSSARKVMQRRGRQPRRGCGGEAVAARMTRGRRAPYGSRW
jgi:hypothetical protein